MIKTLVMLALAMPSLTQACLWVEGTTIDGHSRKTEGISPADELRRIMLSRPAEELLAKFGVKEKAPVSKEAEAVRTILTGNLAEAISMLQQLEAEAPGKYSVATNLGTAYELKGDNENALKWIKTGLERNPNSHYGSEWLHVLILEAKLAAAPHPGVPLAGHLLNISERVQGDTPIAVNGQTFTARQVRDTLAYQLRERVAFVKPKDPFVADLLYSYALLEANLGTVEGGIGLLNLAREYGFPDEGLLQQHEQQYQAVPAAVRAKSLRNRVALGTAVVILLWYLWHRRRWFFLKRAV